MHTQQIRDNCIRCGHKTLKLMEGSTISTDFCTVANLPCEDVKVCDPAMRTIKKRPYHGCFITEEPIEGVDQK